MGWVRGIEEKRTISRIKSSKRKMGRSLLGADQQLNLALWVDFHTG